MQKLILFLGICSAFALGRKLPVPAKECGKIVGCFGGGSFDDNDVYALCSHAFYDTVGLGEDASVFATDPYEDTDDGGYIQFNRLRKKFPYLKTLAQMQDSYDVSQNITNTKVLTDPKLQQKLVNNIFKFVKKYEFSGINLNLSNSPQGRPSDKKNLVLLLKALNEKFKKERLILSIAVYPTEKTAEILYDIRKISKYVDFINLMTFDFHGTSDDEKLGVGHSSPLYPSLKENAEERKLNIDYVVKYWISQGAPPNKLILGTSFNGLSYTLANYRQIGRGASFTGVGEMGGVVEYYQSCRMTTMPAWKHLYDKEQQVPYIYSGNQLLAYDDTHSIKMKAEYVEKMHLGGAMVWNLSQDDYYGDCGEKFPLLKTLHRVLRNKC